MNWEATFKFRTSNLASSAPVLSQTPSLPASRLIPHIKGPHEHVCGHSSLHAQAPFVTRSPAKQPSLAPPLSPRGAQSSGRVHSRDEGPGSGAVRP